MYSSWRNEVNDQIDSFKEQTEANLDHTCSKHKQLIDELKEKGKNDVRQLNNKQDETMSRFKGEVHKLYKAHLEETREAQGRMHSDLLAESDKMKKYKDYLEELINANKGELKDNPDGVDGLTVGRDIFKHSRIKERTI